MASSDSSSAARAKAEIARICQYDELHPYGILNLEENDGQPSKEQVTKRYKELLMTIHADKNDNTTFEGAAKALACELSP